MLNLLYLLLLVALLVRPLRKATREPEKPPLKAEQEALRTEYGEVVNNFRELTDIRFKLLALLPIATILGTILSAGDNFTPNPWISGFGLIITIALIVYNTRNDQLYGELIARAAELERKLQLHGGQFNQRPAAWLQIRPIRRIAWSVPINHSWAIGWIYKASLIVWLFGILYPMFLFLFQRYQIDNSPLGPPRQVPIALFSTVFSTATVQLTSRSLGNQRKNRQACMRLAAYRAVKSLRECRLSRSELDSSKKWQEAFRYLAEVRKYGGASADSNTVPEMRRQAEFYVRQRYLPLEHSSFAQEEQPHTGETIDSDTAVFLAATLTGQSAWWIYDNYTGRSGKVTSDGRLIGSQCREV